MSSKNMLNGGFVHPGSNNDNFWNFLRDCSLLSGKSVARTGSSRSPIGSRWNYLRLRCNLCFHGRSMRYVYKIRHFTGINYNYSNNHLVLDINYVRIVKNRNDAELKCNSALHIDDQEWLKQIVRNFSCIPPYWKSLYSGTYNQIF